MLTYILRRLVIGLFTLLMITFLVYALIRSIPGTPLTNDLAQIDPARQMSPVDRERLEKVYGLDKPWYEAYFDWLGKLASGDLGQSISMNQPVADIIWERIGPTLMLSVSSLFLTYLLSIPLGLWVTVHDGSLGERTMSTGLYMLYSLPSFVAALFLQWVFAVKFDWLPLMGMRGDDFETLGLAGKMWDYLLHAVMPITCFTYGSLAYYTRFVKSNMMDAVRQDYVRTARAKGVPSSRVIYHHAFRNTLIPLVTLVGLTLPSLLGGAVILEQIFSWPGMGRLFFDSIRQRDYPTIMALVLIFSSLTLLGQLLADVLYGVIDPRVSYS